MFLFIMYHDYKYVTDSKASDINDRYQLYTDQQITFNADAEIYSIDENLDGTADYAFDKPDFNVREFLSNLVLRWEYRPGSIVYLVWSQNRSCFENIGHFDLGNDFKSLFEEDPKNVFLVKFSYRIGR